MPIHSLSRLVAKVAGKLPLRTVLIVPFVVQIVGTVGLVGYLSFKSGQESVENLAQQLMTQVGERVSDRLTNYLQAPQNAVAANRLAVEQGVLDINDFEQLRQQFWGQITLNPSLQAIYFGNEPGEEIGYGRFQSEENVKQIKQLTGEDVLIDDSYFNILSSTDPGKRKYYLVDSKGNRGKLFYTFPINNRTTEWYRTAKASKQQIWSPISVYKSAPVLGIFALAPIYKEAGKWQGTFVSSFTLATISRFLKQLQFSPSGQIFILEHSGNLVATSEPELPFVKPAQGEPKRLLAVNSKDTRTREIARQLSQKFGNFHTLQTPQQLTLMSNHERQFVRVTPYQDKYGLNWLVVMIVPESDFMEQINANTRTTILLCMVALMGAIIVGILTARWITKPIVRLNNAAKDIAKGEWQKTVEINRTDELGTLSQSFNQMAAQLQQYFIELQASNKSLAESESKLNQILAAIPVGIAVHDRSGKLIYANEQAKALLGIEVLPEATTEQLAVAYQVYLAGTEQLYPVEAIPTVRAIQGEKVRVDDIEIRLLDRRIPLEVYGTPLWDEVGEIVAAIAAFTDITERKQAERILADYNHILETEVDQKTEALRRSEALLNESQRVAMIGSWSWDLVSDKRWWSPQMYRIIGLNPDEYPVPPDVETVNQSIHPEDRERVNQITYNALEQGVSYDLEFRYLRPDGSIHYAFSKGLVERDTEGRVTHFWGISQDISDRKAIEIALQESETRLRLALDVSGAIAWERDLQTDELLFSSTTTPLLPQKVSYETSMSLVHPDDREKLDRANQDAIAERGAFQIEHRVAAPGQTPEWRWYQVSAKVLTDATGTPTCMIGMSIDITERKLAEETLREKEEQLQLALEASGDGFWDWNLQKGTVYLSRRYLKMLGYEADELPQELSTWDRLIHPDDKHWVMETLNAHLANSSVPYKFDYRLLTKSGKWKWIANYGKVVARDQDGTALRMTGTHRNVNDKKLAELELQQAKEAAEVANQAKSTFLANMSHELRTPLNAILGFARLMSNAPTLPLQHQEQISIISRSSEHLLTLINDVLDLAKIEANRTTFNEQEFDFYQLLSDVEQMFRFKAQAKGLELTIIRDHQVPQYVRTDEIKLRQVLINLLSNAIKFTETGGLSLRIQNSNTQLPLSHCQIDFEVSDTGAGIAPEELDSIFEAFVQASTGKQSVEGTGLGLAISRAFVELMGGEIKVRSVVGKGSTFNFDICVPVADTTSLKTQQPSRRVIALELNQPRYRILIVDDKIDNRQLLFQLLSPFGFELKEATNGKEAVEIWKRFEPHLIFMDVRMSVMNGYEAAKQIKSTAKGQATAIIAVSASTVTIDTGMTKDTNFDDFIHKPFREIEIFEAMSQHIGVRFVYEESNGIAQTPPTQVTNANVDNLAKLSADLVAKLYQATLEGDFELMLTLIEEIRSENDSLATVLAALANHFQFKELLDLLEPLNV